MATISILVGDTHAQRQTKVNAAVGGDAIEFENGTHVFASGEVLEIPDGTSEITIGPASGATVVLQKSSEIGQHTQPMLRIGSYNTVDDLTFDKAGIIIRDNSTNVEITDCTFKRICGSRGVGIQWWAPVTTLEISGCTFEDFVQIVDDTRIYGDVCIQGYFLTGGTITLNVARNIHRFLRLYQNWPAGSTSVGGSNTITDNLIEHYGGTPFTFHGAGDNSSLVVTENVIRLLKPENVTSWNSLIGIEVLISGLDGPTISNNVIIGDRPGTGSGDPLNMGLRTGIVLDGSTAGAPEVKGNWIAGVGTGFRFINSANVVFSDNHYSELFQATYTKTNTTFTTETVGTSYAVRTSMPDYKTIADWGVPDEPSDAVTVWPAPTDEGQIFLSDIMEQFTVAENGLGPIERDLSVGTGTPGDGSTLTIAGNTYSKGLGTHAYSKIVLPLNGRYSRFRSYVGIDDATDSDALAQFVVWADGVELFRSAWMRRGDSHEVVDVDLFGRQSLTLEVLGGATTTSDHTDWAFARVILAPESTIPSSETYVKAEYIAAEKKITLTMDDGTVRTFYEKGSVVPPPPPPPPPPPDPAAPEYSIELTGDDDGITATLAYTGPTMTAELWIRPTSGSEAQYPTIKLPATVGANRVTLATMRAGGGQWGTAAPNWHISAKFVLTIEGTTYTTTEKSVQMTGTVTSPAPETPPLDPVIPAPPADAEYALSKEHALQLARNAGNRTRALVIQNFDFTEQLNFENGAQNVWVLNCRFHDISGGLHVGHGIRVIGGARNCVFAQNLFERNGAEDIMGWGDWSNTLIAKNTHKDGFEGVHLPNYVGTNLRVLANTFYNMRRMGIELQGANAVNTLVQGNVCDFPDLSRTYDGTFGLSIMNFGTGTKVLDNIIRGPSGNRKTPTYGVAVGIEYSGSNGECSRNRVEGTNESLCLVWGTGTKVQNNTFINAGHVAIWFTGVQPFTNATVTGNTISTPGTAFLFASGGNKTTGSGLIQGNSVTAGKLRDGNFGGTFNQV